MKGKLLTVLGVLLLAVGVICAAYIGVYFYRGNAFEKESLRLAQEFRSITQTGGGQSLPQTPEYQDAINAFKEKNEDTVGWVFIEDTEVDYPVVQTTDNDYYLNHSFERANEARGAIYMDYRVNPAAENQNRIIYGHYMKDNTMFARLNNYENEEFYQSHSVISFINQFGVKEDYQIISVFFWEDGITDFHYNSYINMADKTKFDEFTARAKELSLYSAAPLHTKNRSLITLSSCYYRNTDNRIVIVGQKI